MNGYETTLAIDLALSLGSGEPFLGQFGVPAPVTVAILSGEAGPFTLQETARRISVAKDIALADADVLWGFTLPRIARVDDLREVAERINEHGIDVFCVDPAYLALLVGDTKGRQGRAKVSGTVSRENIRNRFGVCKSQPSRCAICLSASRTA